MHFCTIVWSVVEVKPTPQSGMQLCQPLGRIEWRDPACVAPDRFICRWPLFVLSNTKRERFVAVLFYDLATISPRIYIVCLAT